MTAASGGKTAQLIAQAMKRANRVDGESLSTDTASGAWDAQLSDVAGREILLISWKKHATQYTPNGLVAECSFTASNVNRGQRRGEIFRLLIDSKVILDQIEVNRLKPPMIAMIWAHESRAGRSYYSLKP